MTAPSAFQVPVEVPDRVLLKRAAPGAPPSHILQRKQLRGMERDNAAFENLDRDGRSFYRQVAFYLYAVENMS